jgi:VanZ family protein
MPSRQRLFFEYWLPVLAYATVIIVLSSQPNLKPPFHFENSDKWMHLLEYGGLGFVLVRALRVSMPRRDPLVASLVAFGMSIGMSIGDEFLQSFIPGRESSPLDVMADLAGVLLAQLLYMAFVRD